MSADPSGRTGAARELVRMLTAGGLSTDRLASAPTVADIRSLARRRLPRMAFDFVDGGAGAENTLRSNVEDLAKVTFRPQSMRDVSQIDLGAEVVGQSLPVPMVLAPCGLVRVIGGDGELHAVRAAGRAGLTYTISTASSFSIEEIADQATGPLWFQLYMWRSEEVVDTLVRRAGEAGCSAVVVTIDVAVNGTRPRDHRNGMSIPPQITWSNALGGARHPAWLRSLLTGRPLGFRNLQGIAEGSSAMSHQEYVNTQLANLSASWDDVVRLRRRWDGALLVKGITSVADARSAADAGADGIVVSNHGGRQLDSTPSSISVLPRIVDAVGDRVDVIMDSGVRTGADVLKAVSLGAKAAGVGRAWVYGAAAGGDRGVTRVLDILVAEMRETMILLGRSSATELDRDAVSFPQAWRGPEGIA